MTHTLEQQIRDEAKRKGFAVQKTESGYVVTDRHGHGIVRATPATLEEVKAFIDGRPA